MTLQDLTIFIDYNVEWLETFGENLNKIMIYGIRANDSSLKKCV